MSTFEKVKKQDKGPSLVKVYALSWRQPQIGPNRDIKVHNIPDNVKGCSNGDLKEDVYILNPAIRALIGRLLLPLMGNVQL